jgi:hypothetical protein
VTTVFRWQKADLPRRHGEHGEEEIQPQIAQIFADELSCFLICEHLRNLWLKLFGISLGISSVFSVVNYLLFLH